MLKPEYTSQFERDIRRLQRERVATEELKKIIALVLEDTPSSRTELTRRHDAHVLKGRWSGSNECYVANAGDWLLVWMTGNGLATFQRTGTHNDIFRH